MYGTRCPLPLYTALSRPGSIKLLRLTRATTAKLALSSAFSSRHRVHLINNSQNCRSRSKGSYSTAWGMGHGAWSRAAGGAGGQLGRKVFGHFCCRLRCVFLQARAECINLKRTLLCINATVGGVSGY